jgi:hypothetical protein
MTLDEYKRTCAEVLDGFPLELCVGHKAFKVGEWQESYRLTLLRLYTLYEKAAIHETAADNEPMRYFDHWWALPVSDELKKTVFENIKAF